MLPRSFVLALLLAAPALVAVPPAAVASSCTASGCELWRVEVAGPLDRASGNAIALRWPMADVVVATGFALHKFTPTEPDQDRYYTAAYDAATGAVLWTRHHFWAGYSTPHDAHARDVVISMDGTRVAVTGGLGVTHWYDGATGTFINGILTMSGGIVGTSPARPYDHPSAAAIANDSRELYVAASANTSSWGHNLVVSNFHIDGGPAFGWQKGDGTPDDDRANDLALSSIGQLAYVGGRRVDTGTPEFRVVTLETPTGTPVWSYSHPTTLGSRGIVAARWADGGDALYVIGNRGGLSEDWLVLALDGFTGALLWSRAIDGASGGNDYARDVTVSHDGTLVFATGSLEGAAAPGDVAVVALDAATGAEVWRHVVPNAGADVGVKVRADPSGEDVVVVGDLETPGGGSEILVRGLDPTTGALRWSVTKTGTHPGPAHVNDLVVTADAAYLTGNVTGASGSVNMLTLAVSLVDVVPNQPPVALFSVAPPNCEKARKPITFDGTASYDTDGVVVAWDWDFGDSTTGTGSTTTHSYWWPGLYAVHLTVTDDDGATDLVAREVCVLDAAGVEILPPSQSKTVGLATSADYTFTIKNTGTLTDTYALSTFPPTSGWSSQILDSATLTPITSITIPVGSTDTVVFRVTPPSTATGGTGFASWKATSTYDPAVWDTATTVTMVDATAPPCGLIPVPPC